jgi:hypothetical protein
LTLRRGAEGPRRRAEEHPKPAARNPTARFHHDDIGTITRPMQDLRPQLAAAAALQPGCPQDRFSGRGIVICAGGARLFTCAWVEIALLRRHLGCTLPIEVWHIGSGELGPAMRSLLADLGAETVDALEVARRHPTARLGGWELKAFALMHSRFREVLLLDADNVPVRDPEFLFDTPEYQAGGAMFWPDIVRLARGNPIWSLAGLPFRDMPAFESGQILLDKTRCWPALVLAHWINQRSDTFYEILHGDKDTFLIAWLMTAQAFHLVPFTPRLIQDTMCQRDPQGGVMFQHRNGAKWILDGSNPAIEGFKLEAECLALLGELRKCWDGTVFNPPARSPEARQAERELVRGGYFRLTRLSSDEAPLQLLADHRIGPGAPHELCHWHVRDGSDGCELVLEHGGRPSCTLARGADGIWRGRWRWSPGMAVELASATPGPAPAPIARADLEWLGLVELLDRVVASYAALPCDAQAARDLLGTLRTLTTLEPRLADRLRELSPTGENGPGAGHGLAEVIRLVLGDIAVATERGAGTAPVAGRQWPQQCFQQGTLYTRNRGS